MSQKSTQQDIQSRIVDDALTKQATSFGDCVNSTKLLTICQFSLVLLACCYTLYFVRSLILPVVLAVILNILLTPAVRWLKRVGIPLPIGAVVVLLLVLGVTGYGVYVSSGPAIDFAQEVPQRIREIEFKLRGIAEPVEKVGDAVKQIEDATGNNNGSPEVVVRGPGLIRSGFSYVQSIGIGGLIVFILLLFLLASGDTFLTKLVRSLPTFREKKRAVEIFRAIESDLGHYLFTVTVINFGLAVVSGIAFYIIGVSNAIGWGIAVGVANYVPYLGPVVVIIGLLLAGIVNFDTWPMMLAPAAAFSIINIIEAYVFTPIFLGRRLNLNPVAVIISLLFWGWIWGIIGAVLAVPILTAIKIMGDHVESMKPISQFLSRHDVDSHPAVAKRR